MATTERSNLAGPIVRKFRKSNDWTQREFAKMLREFGWKKCDRRWVSRLESGDVILRDVDMPYLEAILGEDFGSQLASHISKEARAKAAARLTKRILRN